MDFSQHKKNSKLKLRNTWDQSQKEKRRDLRKDFSGKKVGNSAKKHAKGVT